MIVMPAVDLREGACVQLVGGRFEDERVRLADPVAVARAFREAGFRRLHVVDLDAATGRGSNASVVQALLAEPGLACQVGGGVRDEQAIGALLAAGAARVVVGTRAVEDAAWLAAMTAAFPDRIVVAADVRGRRITTHGWANDDGPDVSAFVARLQDLPLAAVLVTAVHREGALAGTDLPLLCGLAAETRVPLHASGGITTTHELRRLADAGVSAAVLGMALYTGALVAAELLEDHPQ